MKRDGRLQTIIDEVGKPIVRDYVFDYNPPSKKKKPVDPSYRHVKPEDLSKHAASLQQLIEHARGAYQGQVDLLKHRVDGTYPKKLPRATKAENELGGVDEEYRRWENKEWAELWEGTVPWNERTEPSEYANKPFEGNPRNWDNKTNPDGPRPAYLRPIYPLVKWWWEEKAKLGDFGPDFDHRLEEEKPYYFERCNSDARLLHLIVQECDPKYTIENSANLQRDFRKRKPLS
jgi:hypothetical protein